MRCVKGNVRHRFLCLLIPAVGLTACYKSTVPPGECKNELMSELFSGDRQWKAVLFSRQCGDSPSELQVSVLASRTSLSSEAGNAFRQDARREWGGHHLYNLRQAWKGPHELWISHNRAMKVGYAASQVGVVTVVNTDAD